MMRLRNYGGNRAGGMALHTLRSEGVSRMLRGLMQSKQKILVFYIYSKYEISERVDKFITFH